MKLLIDADELLAVFGQAFDCALAIATPLPSAEKSLELIKQTKKAREEIGAKFRLYMSEKLSAKVSAGEITFLEAMASVNTGSGDGKKGGPGSQANGGEPIARVTIDADADLGDEAP